EIRATRKRRRNNQRRRYLSATYPTRAATTRMIAVCPSAETRTMIGSMEPRDAKRAGHGRQNRSKPGQELREQHRPDAKPEKEVLRPPHTYVRLERESTQPRQDLRSAPPPQLVPREIDGQGCDHDRADHEPQVDAPRRRERARREQRRNRRQRNTKLFR